LEGNAINIPPCAIAHPAANIVDQFVFFDSVLRPFCIELKLLRPFFLRLGDRHKIGAGAAAFYFFIRDSLIIEFEVTAGSSKGELIIGFSITTWLMLDYIPD